MHIAFEARSLASAGSGVRTYTSQLLQHLIRLHAGDRYTALLTQSLTRDVTGTDALVIPQRAEWLLPWWLHRQVPAALRSIAPDIVHFTKADMPKLSLPTVATIFDIIPVLFPDSQAWLRRLYWPGALRRAATLSTHIITISEASKRDIVEHFGCNPQDITVTKLAADLAHFQPSGLSGRKPIILFVGTRDQRKNVRGLLRAFAQIQQQVPHQLVIIGKDALLLDRAEAHAEQLGIAERVTFKKFVSYEELPHLYREAQLFVWPSIYEGWGFPPQEAMACGTPVIVSDGGALPEVVGDAGSVIPFSTADLTARTRDADFERRLAQEMLAVLGDEERRQAMHEEGLRRVRKFSWEDVAVATRQVYEKVCG